MTPYLIGIDVGTSGVKSELFDASGRSVTAVLAEYPMLQPENGWAEERCEDWWNAVKKSLQQLCQALPQGGVVAGIGLSGQMHSLVLLDEHCRPLRNAILWCDTRSETECRDIEATVGKDRLLAITGNAALAGFTLSKLMWVKRHEPQIYEKIAHILLPKDYIRFCLTGVLATDRSDAAGTQLLDIRERCWSEELCRVFGIDRAWLPALYESGDVTGTVSGEAAEATGLDRGIPVVGGAADNAAAAVGSGCVLPGRAFLSIGTSGVLYLHTGALAVDPAARCHSFCSAVPGEYYMMGVTQAAGLSLQWVRRQLFPQLQDEAKKAGVSVYAYLDDLARSSQLGANRLLYLPYLMGERTPYLNGDLRGAFFGLSAAHTQADLIRAVLEGVAFSLKNCLSVFQENQMVISGLRICGGGAKSEIWRQIFADVLGMPLLYSGQDGGASAGAAIFAGVGAGIYSTVADGCVAFGSSLCRQEYDLAHTARYDAMFRVFQALSVSIADCCLDLQQ